MGQARVRIAASATAIAGLLGLLAAGGASPVASGTVPPDPAPELVSVERVVCDVTVTFRSAGSPVNVTVLQGMQGFLIHDQDFDLPAGELGVATWQLGDEGGYVTYLNSVAVHEIAWGDRSCADSGGLTDALPDIDSVTRDVCTVTVRVLAFGAPFTLRADQGPASDALLEQSFGANAGDYVTVSFTIDGSVNRGNQAAIAVTAGADAAELAIPGAALDACWATQGASDQAPAEPTVPPSVAPPPSSQPPVGPTTSTPAASPAPAPATSAPRPTLPESR